MEYFTVISETVEAKGGIICSRRSYTRITVALVRGNFLLFFSQKTIEIRTCQSDSYTRMLQMNLP